MLSKESLVTAGEGDFADIAGGSALFPRHVLRRYAVMGAVLFAVALNVAQRSNFRAQLLFNEVAIFMGAPLLMIRMYRLKVGEAPASRPVRPLAWLGVLLAVPSGILTAAGVFQLASLVLPVPDRVLGQFGREIMPEGIPMWQLILFASVLSGIWEETGFRGTLMYGLRRMK